MLVSVTCPTRGRPERHAALYAAFARQTHPDLELWVLDDSAEPSPFFAALRDPRVRYEHVAWAVSVGSKRNLMAERAGGEVVVHFDDDDDYAPDYVARMLDALGPRGDLVKLAAWVARCEPTGALWYWDTRALERVHWYVDGYGQQNPHPDMAAWADAEPERAAAYLDATRWGYGFSYVYRRAAALRCPFDDVFHGEDYAWVRALRGAGATLRDVPDVDGLVVHTLHGTSSSWIVPQRQVPPSIARAVDAQGVVALRGPLGAWLAGDAWRTIAP